MADRIEGSSWPTHLAITVGQQVKYYRERPEWRVSAQTLADRTRSLGHELKRSVIANLESGRRGYVTLADMLVLAMALDVPPIALMVPIRADQDAKAVLGGLTDDVWSAVEWIKGAGYPTNIERPWLTDTRGWDEASHPFFIKHLLDMTVSRLIDARADAEDAALSERERKTSLELVKEIRRNAVALQSELVSLGVQAPSYSTLNAILDD